MNQLQKDTEGTLAKLQQGEITPEQALEELIEHGNHPDDAEEMIDSLTGGGDLEVID